MEQDTSASIQVSLDPANHFSYYGNGGDPGANLRLIYAPQPHPFYYRGYENGINGWSDQHQVFGAEGLDVGSSGIYSDNHSFLFPNGFGYSPQMTYTPYSPVTSPLAHMSGDTQVYSHQQFHFSGNPYYSHFVPSSLPFITSAAPHSESELVVMADQQVNGAVLGSSILYPAEHGSLGTGDITGNSGILAFHEFPDGFDGYWPAGPFPEWSNSARAPQTQMQVAPPSVSLRNLAMTARPFYGSGCSIPNNRAPMGPDCNRPGQTPSVSSCGSDKRSGSAPENNRWAGRGGPFSRGCSNTGASGEQNRGPRFSRPRRSEAYVESMGHQNSGNVIVNEVYNRADFVTQYEDARFFIIKSYNEDNIHRSIKYGIWASTANGNKKLDTAYYEVKEKKRNCPVFLFFSVNASAHFCGVAEMVGPVDFKKNADYWMQDKWSGQFPVLWQIIKDVPNTQFRHIILENNDRKPVTNSRDTQEVNLGHGIKMLNIFKNYKADASILDDFDYYELRQKEMVEQRAGPQLDHLSKKFSQSLCVVDGDANGPGPINMG